jgi:uncharacterized Zn finger protein
MNLEQIVKETVAKIVAEKQGKDLTGDGKIDSADYLQARSNAIEKAKNLDEDYEVAMAQDSLDSIIRAAMMLKTQMGDNEVNLPAWIQDHITNSENYINQAAKGYHESDAQIANHAGEQEMNEVRVSQDNVVNYLANALQSVWNAGKGNNSIDFQDFAQSLYSDMFGDDSMYEARFKKGEDVGGKGFEFKDIAKKAAKQYGSKEAGQRVAGAVMKKVLNKEGNLGHNETSSIEQEGAYWIVTYNTADGTKEKSFKSEDEARKFYNGLDEVFKPKSSFDDYSVGDNVTVSGKKVKITNMKMDDETGERRARVKFEDGSTKEVNINSLDESQQEIDEATIRRWQHYAGIK